MAEMKATKKLPEADGITVHCEHTKIEPIGKLKPYPNNNKTHPEAQIEFICKAIKAQGWRAPITVSNQTGYIVRGHGRLEAAKRIGLKRVPVDYQNYASTEAENMDRIADNKLSELAEWNLPNLKDEIEKLDSGEFDMDLTGFTQEEIEGLMTQFHQDEPADAEPQTDRAAELNKKWKVKTGDLFQIGEHRLLCGDSTKADDVGRLMGGEKAGCVLTDPPYGMNLDTDWSDAVGSIGSIGHKNKTAGNKYSPVIGDDKPFDPGPIFALWDAPEMFLFGADYYAENIPNRTEGSWLCWDKRKPSQENAIGAEFELCWSKAKHKRRMLRHDWFGFLSSQNGSDARNRQHPTQKPVSLIADIMRQWTESECVVSDPFLGSGTTMVAAQNTNRKCYGIEISCDYCAVILQRMKDAFPDIKIEKAK